jgi:hypothetical protein
LPGRTIIRSNTFRDAARPAITIYAHGRNAWAHDITITGNTITGWCRAAIQVANVDGGTVTRNTIGRGTADPGRSTPIVARASRKLRIAGNAVNDDRPGLLAACDLAATVGDAPALTGNSFKLHRELPALMAIVPPARVQLPGQPPRPIKPGEDTGAFLKAATATVSGRSERLWSLHPPFKKGLRGAVVFELPLHTANGMAVRFRTRKACANGDGVVLTVAWKPAGAADDQYATCFAQTIRATEWTPGKAAVPAKDAAVTLRLTFDCGPAGNTAFDSVQIAEIVQVDS